MKYKHIASVAVLGLSLSTVACGGNKSSAESPEGAMEEAGKEVDEAADKVGDKAEEAAEEIEDAAEDITE